MIYNENIQIVYLDILSPTVFRVICFQLTIFFYFFYNSVLPLHIHSDKYELQGQAQHPENKIKQNNIK
jgi:hypothetical protein